VRAATRLYLRCLLPATSGKASPRSPPDATHALTHLT